jgi:Tfp pilus assembly protein PilF
VSQLRSSPADETTTALASSAELVTLGIAANSNGELDQAQELFRTAIEQDGNNGEAHLHLGRLAKRRGNLVEACASLRCAVELLEDNDTARFELGTTLTEMGYISEAETIFSDLVARESQGQQTAPQRPSRAKLALANVRLDGLGQRSKAYQVYCDACEAGSAPMAVLAGVAADSLGDHGAALEFYQGSYGQNKADEEAALHLMVSLLRVGDKEGAAALRLRLPNHMLSSVDYIMSTPVGMDPSMHFFTHDMLQLALQSTRRHEEDAGLILEFGVYHGKTIRMIASYFPNDPVHGFDTFSGIPEDWHYTPRNSYSTHGTLPQAPANVEYHVGLFSETLPGFLEAHPGQPISFMNIDCDLYSSTKDVFDAVSDRVVPGTIIVFDEYVMNPHWEQDEYKAFQEAVAKHGWKYNYLGISLVSQQAVVQIIE